MLLNLEHQVILYIYIYIKTIYISELYPCNKLPLTCAEIIHFFTCAEVNPQDSHLVQTSLAKLVIQWEMHNQHGDVDQQKWCFNHSAW